MRVLLVSQMYPGPRDPDLGAFVAQVERGLLEEGHRVARVVVDRRGGPPTKHLRLGIDALRAARQLRPDVVFGHFLVPAGAIAALAARAAGAPLVVMAHGQDVRNAAERPAVARATRATVRAASAVIANSQFLRKELERVAPEAAGKIEVIDCGVDMERFAGREGEGARAAVGWHGEAPRFLFAGSLIDRKNIVRLADAFARFERGSLALVGDGPLRAELAGRERVHLAGRVDHDQVPVWMGASDVLCLPSLVEPLGQVVLEAMASERSVVATRVGGPPELVPPEAGALVDPLSVDSIERGMRHAAGLPTPNRAARAAAATHDSRRQVRRMAAVLERAMDG